MTTSTTIRSVTALFAAGLMICGGAAVASAAETTVGDDDVNVNVSITPITEPGVLTLSVATDSTALTENTPGGVGYRQFDGTLPTVTVTDTRAVEDIPAGASWYVLGSASDFTATGLPSIPGENLGWTPATVGTVSDSVFAGEPVAGALDGSGPGLTDRELLFTSADSTDGAPGSWSANAALRLRTPIDVTPGDYTSTVTVTLFENSL